MKVSPYCLPEKFAVAGKHAGAKQAVEKVDTQRNRSPQRLKPH
jgi:hypothetical protein